MSGRLKRWLCDIRDGPTEDETAKVLLHEDPDIREAHERYRRFVRDDDARQAYEDRMKYLRDQAARSMKRENDSVCEIRTNRPEERRDRKALGTPRAG